MTLIQQHMMMDDMADATMLVGRLMNTMDIIVVITTIIMINIISIHTSAPAHVTGRVTYGAASATYVEGGVTWLGIA